VAKVVGLASVSREETNAVIGAEPTAQARTGLTCLGADTLWVMKLFVPQPAGEDEPRRPEYPEG
jgi:hypothetical protein